MLRTEYIENRPVAFLEGELGIYNARAERDALLSYGQSADRLCLDLSGVTHIDSSGIQLLLALNKEAQAQNKALELRNANESVLSALKMMSLVDRFTMEFTHHDGEPR